MTSPLSALSTLLPAAPAASKPADTGSEGSETTSFARELSRAQDADPQPPLAARNGKPAARGKAAADPADAAASPAPEAAAPARRSTDRAEAESAELDAEGQPAGDLSAMINNLLGLSAPPAPPPGTTAAAAAVATSSAAESAGEGAALTAGDDPGAGGITTLPLPAMPGTDARASGPAAAGLGAQGKADAAGTNPSTTELQSRAADLRASAAADGRVPLPASLDLAARAAAEPTPVPTPALPAAGTQAPQVAATSGAPATATPFEARLSAALGSLDFAPAFGHQVRVLVQDGVQHARLHLNPAEMGPITVQIALDGQAAQVHLAAEQPLTRQALEQAMPVLASALREGGLTLSGGGVFEQPRDPQRDGSGAPAGGSRGPGNGRADDSSAGSPATVTPRRLRGAVDLIA
jgi:flagellar hook-length control protein FliK